MIELPAPALRLLVLPIGGFCFDCDDEEVTTGEDGKGGVLRIKAEEMLLSSPGSIGEGATVGDG